MNSETREASTASLQLGGAVGRILSNSDDEALAPLSLPPTPDSSVTRPSCCPFPSRKAMLVRLAKPQDDKAEGCFRGH